MRRGGWRQAALTPGDLFALEVVLVVSATVRAFDYFTGVDRDARSAVVAEVVMPLWGWGVLIAAGAVILADGLARRRHMLVFIGHLWLAVAYWSLTLGLAGSYVGDVFEHGVMPGSTDGMRGVAPLAIIALLHLLYAARTGTHPLPQDAGVTDAAIVKEA